MQSKDIYDYFLNEANPIKTAYKSKRGYEIWISKISFHDVFLFFNHRNFDNTTWALGAGAAAVYHPKYKDKYLGEQRSLRHLFVRQI
ncbi:MAG: hypothetical protein IK015_09745 [Treponema sp.]|nr:hypothetical protein [Treponema sp.]